MRATARGVGAILKPGYYRNSRWGCDAAKENPEGLDLYGVMQPAPAHCQNSFHPNYVVSFPPPPNIVSPAPLML